MELIFDLLKAEEIECRIGTTKQPQTDKQTGEVKPGGVSLLLYKDARCDMARLDKTVGAMGWQREHSRDNANCKVSIWDDEKKMWVSKEDVGVASRTEAEKGIASDSFKRSCVNWGIGRELYTAPFIWISGNPDTLKWERFKVKEIGYDENRCINALTIVDKRNKVVFKMGSIEEIEPDTEDSGSEPPKQVTKNATVSTSKTLPAVANLMRNEISDIQEKLKLNTYDDARKKVFAWGDELMASGAIEKFEWLNITQEQAKNLFEAIRKTYKPGEAA